MDRIDPLSETLEFPDFINEASFDQIVDLIQEECAHPDTLLKYNTDSGSVDGKFLDPEQGNMPDYDYKVDQNSVLDPFTSFKDHMKENGDEGNDGEDSSATAITPTKKLKVDRSRTLISERRRRCRMKEKLYALRSLVPNITKMDKASIIRDAVFYVQELQRQANKLKDDIACLESTNKGRKCCCGSEITENLKEDEVPRNDQTLSSKLLQIDLLEVDKRAFHVRLVCNRGDGVTGSLYQALESITGFNVQTSNLAVVLERYIFTFTLDVKESEPDVDPSVLKARIAGLLLGQGFELQLPMSM